MTEKHEKLIKIPTDSVELEGILEIPDEAKGLVLFAHGSGSSRFSPRNNFIAQILNKNRFATLLFDLLSEEEDTCYRTRFDIDLLTKRLVAATERVQNFSLTEGLRLGYFGASTGAAAALKAAAIKGSVIGAVVSRGGRADLAKADLERVQSPSLLIVGGNDQPVIELNKLAFSRIKAKKELTIVPGATHLFEEPGALEEVARLSTEWFDQYLTG